jgi:hypothetical protein
MTDDTKELRDVFAAVALHGLLMSDRLLTHGIAAKLAYTIADQMLSERAAVQPPETKE